MGDTRNFAALDWVTQEIDETLAHAREALESWANDPNDNSKIRFCLAHIHQVHGSLQMVEFYGAALLAEELEHLAQALCEQRVQYVVEAQEALMRGILQLPIYLDRIKTRRRDQPAVLLPLLNDLRSVRGDNLMSESRLFNPDLRPAKQVSGQRIEANLDQSHYLSLQKKLQQMYQYAAAAIVQGVKIKENIVYLHKVITRQYKLTMGSQNQALWEVTLAFTEALAENGLELSAATKLILRQLNRQLKLLMHHGVVALDEPCDEELLRNLLFYIAISSSNGKSVTRIRNKYDLNTNLLGEEDHSELPLGHDPEAIRSVVLALKEELRSIKLSLDDCLTSESSMDSLRESLPIAQRVADTLAILGVGDIRKQMLSQVYALENIVEAGEFSDQQVFDIADNLIDIEGRLEALTQGVSIARNDIEHQKAMHLNIAQEVVLAESRNGLEQTKDCIIEYIASQWDRRHLVNVPKLLREIRGGLDMVPLLRAANVLGNCADYIENHLLQDGVIPEWQALDTLADAIASIEYYLENLSSNDSNSNDEMLLTVAEDSVRSLEQQAAEQAAAANLEPELEPSEEPSFDAASEASTTEFGTDASADTATDMGTGHIPTEDAIRAAYADFAASDSEDEPNATESELEPLADPHETPVLSDSVEVPTISTEVSDEEPTFSTQASVQGPEPGVVVDQEILEIFIEEAQEVTATINEFYPSWADSYDQEARDELRRAFHTLKGSGRMVGATDIGELAWSIENMFNRLIDRSIEPHPTQTHLVDLATQLLPSLIDAFEHGQPNPEPELSQSYMIWAHELATGEIPEDLLRPNGDPATSAVDTEDTLPSGDFDQSEEESEEESRQILLEVFSAEASGHLATINEFLAEMEQAKPLYSTPSDDMQRALHTLKGGAHMADVQPVARLSTPLEHLIKELRTYQIKLDEDLLQLVEDGVSYINLVLDQIAAQQELHIPKLEQFIARVNELRERTLEPVIHHQEGEQGKPRSVDPELLAIFMAEEMNLLLDADELIDKWLASGSDLLEMNAVLDEIQRLKTGANHANHPEMEQLSELMETIYSAGIADELPNQSRMYGILRRCHDALLDMVDCVAASQSVPSLSIGLRADIELLLDSRQPATPDAGIEDTQETEPASNDEVSAEQVEQEQTDASLEDDTAQSEPIDAEETALEAAPEQTPVEPEQQPDDTDQAPGFDATGAATAAAAFAGLGFLANKADATPTSIGDTATPADLSGDDQTPSTPDPVESEADFDDLSEDIHASETDDAHGELVVNLIDPASNDTTSKLADAEADGEDLQLEEENQEELAEDFTETATDDTAADTAESDVSEYLPPDEDKLTETVSETETYDITASLVDTESVMGENLLDKDEQEGLVEDLSEAAADDATVSLTEDEDDVSDDANLEADEQEEPAEDLAEAAADDVTVSLAEAEDDVCEDTQLEADQQEEPEEDLAEAATDDETVSLNDAEDDVSDDAQLEADQQEEPEEDLAEAATDDATVSPNDAEDDVSDDAQLEADEQEEPEEDLAEATTDDATVSLAEAEDDVSDDTQLEADQQEEPEEDLAEVTTDDATVSLAEAEDDASEDTQLEGDEPAATESPEAAEFDADNSEQPLDEGVELAAEFATLENPETETSNLHEQEESDASDNDFSERDWNNQQEPSPEQPLETELTTDNSIDPTDDLIADQALAAASFAAFAASTDGQDNTGEDDTELPEEEVDQEIVEIFAEEATELLEEIDNAIHDWSNDWDNTDCIEQLQRCLHTYKGSARLAGILGLGEAAHDFETLLTKEGYGDLGQSFFDRINSYYELLFAGTDDIHKFIQDEQIPHLPQLMTAGDLTLENNPYLDNEDEPDQDADSPSQDPLATTTDEEEQPQEPEVTAVEPLAPESSVTEAAIEASRLDDSNAANVVPFAPRKTIEETPIHPLTPIKQTESVGGPPVQKFSGSQVAQRGSQESVKLPAELLEELVNLAGETSISRARMEEQMNEIGFTIDEMDFTIERLQEQLRRLDIETEAQVLFRQEQMEHSEDFDPLEMDRYSSLQQLSRSLMESASDLLDLKSTLTEKTRDTETLLLQQSRINTELQEGLMRSRMVPFARLVPRLRRIVRQVATELGKRVVLELDNIEGELDRTMLERMIAPLEHMIRNAIDHGIEMPSARVAMGKDETGTIRLELERDGGEVVLNLADDGRGINIDRVRETAIESGLMNSDAELTDHDIMQFILTAGFSTAQNVTQISGRGVGMDVVNSEIKQLGGVVSIDSSKGEGTTFKMRLPFTLSVNRALMVSLHDDTYAVPLNTIEGIVRISPFELEHYYAEPDARFEYAGQQYQVRYLGSLLDENYRPELEGHALPLPVLLVRSQEYSVALQVDNLLGSREVVVKGLGPQFAGVEGLAGATVMGDGSVVVILDSLALVRRLVAQAFMIETHPVQPQEPTEIDITPKDEVRTVMIVDDSVTVRKVTTRFLEREGYDVITAKDGVDALRQLQDTTPDIMLLDIEMPRMDGFEVAKNVRSNSHLHSLPIIMITSRTGSKHRDRAYQLGVNNYLGKPYQEDELLASIKELTEQAITVV